MANCKWCSGELPQDILITQVYGILFTSDKRILLKCDNGHYSLPGGKPESFDNNLEDTLRRECIEEINVKIHKPYIVGYQLVDDENGSKPYAQIRMAALIKEIGLSKPDDDNGRLYDKVFATSQKAIKLLDWGLVGEQQIKAALDIAEQNFNFDMNK